MLDNSFTIVRTSIGIVMKKVTVSQELKVLEHLGVTEGFVDDSTKER